MRKSLKLLMPLAAAAVPLAMMPGIAFAQGNADPTYQATLNPINDSGASGMVTISINGDTATVTEHVSGLATTFNDAPYPHAQHVHINGQGKCPTPSMDSNGDGIVDTVEGVPAYGHVGTSLTTSGDTSAKSAVAVKRFPGGGSYDYSRTFTMNADTIGSIEGGTGVVVVHGLNPANLSKKAQGEKSNLAPKLPLAATAPALCGELTMMPTSAPQTGTGSTAGPEHLGLFGAGGAAVILGGGVLLWTRKRDRADAGTQS